MNPMTDLLGTLSADGDAVTVTFEQRYDTDGADLWDAVTTPERLARWFAPVTGDLSEGGTFALGFDDGTVPGCRVTRCDAPHGFDWEWPHPVGSSSIHVEVHEEGDASRLVLVHRRLGAGSAPAYAAGWQAYLLTLGSHLAGDEPGGWWEEFDPARAAYAAQLGPP